MFPTKRCRLGRPVSRSYPRAVSCRGGGEHSRRRVAASCLRGEYERERERRRCKSLRGERERERRRGGFPASCGGGNPCFFRKAAWYPCGVHSLTLMLRLPSPGVSFNCAMAASAARSGMSTNKKPRKPVSTHSTTPNWLHGPAPTDTTAKATRSAAQWRRGQSNAIEESTAIVADWSWRRTRTNRRRCARTPSLAAAASAKPPRRASSLPLLPHTILSGNACPAGTRPMRALSCSGRASSDVRRAQLPKFGRLAPCIEPPREAGRRQDSCSERCGIRGGSG
jgi:hypothetical protein